jgi:hypothetical protein
MPQSAQDAEDGCPSGQHLSADCIAHASLRVAGSELMLGDSPGDKTDRYAGFTLVLDTRTWPRASAGSIASPTAGASRWPGRKPSGPTALVKPSTALASRGW